MSLYSQRGVSAQKEDVHKATENLNKGLYPFAFCRIYDDYLSGDDNWVNVMHADGAGTKSILAYLYWKETGDITVWRGIAQDAIVMNLDDLLCIGVYDRILFSATVDRNKKQIPGDVLKELIDGSQAFFDMLSDHNVNIKYLGGETADVGDVVRTISVNGTMAARWAKNKLVTNENIREGDVIVGLASFGQASYESFYNSGIGSNGLTSARHDILKKDYGTRFPETYEATINENVVYIGSHRLSDIVNPGDDVLVNGKAPLTVGSLLLSPTRTYAPFVKGLLEAHFDQVHGLIHCSGGGQTKCLKYLHSNFRIIKDQLFDPPLIFRLIQESSGAENREMYQVFNMGHRLEVFTDENTASAIIELAGSFNIQAKIIGRVESSGVKELVLTVQNQEIIY